jgi:hypothetical protein
MPLEKRTQEERVIFCEVSSFISIKMRNPRLDSILEPIDMPIKGFSAERKEAQNALMRSSSTSSQMAEMHSSLRKQ